MANELISDLTSTVTTADGADLLVIENSETHKKITFANLMKGNVMDTARQSMFFIDITLNQSQVQNLNSTPILLISAPGAGKYIQVVGGSAFLDHNGTDYVLSGGSIDSINLIAGSDEIGYTNLTGGNRMVVSTGDKIRYFRFADELASTGPDVALNTAIDIDSPSDYTGAGGTISVYVQYMIIDTN